MKTDDLISLIAQDAGARPTPLPRRLLAATGIALVLAAGALAATIGFRPDLGEALSTWRFDAKLLSVAAILAGSWSAALHSSRPETEPQAAILRAAVPVLVLVLAIGVELASSPAATWGARAIGSNARLCLIAILGLSVAPFALLLATMRAGAPRSPTLAGASAGLLAGAIGALFYALHCPDDSPFFVALWYTPPIAAMAAIGAVFGSRFLRW